jgi:hypothetical protein
MSMFVINKNDKVEKVIAALKEFEIKTGYIPIIQSHCIQQNYNVLVIHLERGEKRC